MTLRRTNLIALAIVAIHLSPNSTAHALPKDFTQERIARFECEERACVTGIAFTPDGDVLVNERRGRVRVIRDGKLLEDPLAEVETRISFEGGLLGIAVDPDYERDPWIYVFYTVGGGDTDRVERIHADGRREVILDEIPAGTVHHGGVLAFGPDEKLYVANGDHGDRSSAQDKNALGGKIYRLDRDGGRPADNPFDGSLAWSYGHRNPFGIAFDPVTGNLWESENGPSGNDEVNLIERGGNYGWPRAEGDSNEKGLVDPERTYREAVVPTMMAFAGDAFPETHRGHLYLGTYGDSSIRRFVLNEARDGIAEESEFHRADGGVVGVAFGPDGLYYTTDDSVWRIRARAQPPRPSPTQSDGQQVVVPEPGGAANEGGWWPLLVVAAIAALGIITVFFVRRRA